MEAPALSISYHPQPSERTYRYGLLIPAFGSPKDWKATLFSLREVEDSELLVTIASAQSVPQLKGVEREVLVLEGETRRNWLSRKPLIEREALVRSAFDFLVQHHFCQYLILLRPGGRVEPGLLAHLRSQQVDGRWAPLSDGSGWVATSFDYEEGLRAQIEPGWWAALPS